MVSRQKQGLAMPNELALPSHQQIQSEGILYGCGGPWVATWSSWTSERRVWSLDLVPWLRHWTSRLASHRICQSGAIKWAQVFCSAPRSIIFECVPCFGVFLGGKDRKCKTYNVTNSKWKQFFSSKTKSLFKNAFLWRWIWPITIWVMNAVFAFKPCALPPPHLANRPSKIDLPIHLGHTQNSWALPDESTRIHSTQKMFDYFGHVTASICEWTHLELFLVDLDEMDKRIPTWTCLIYDYLLDLFHDFVIRLWKLSCQHKSQFASLWPYCQQETDSLGLDITTNQ